MRARTIFRLCHLQMYGAGVFDEALIDPMKTINKVPTGAEKNFSIPPPRASPVLKMDMDHVTLDDLKKLPWRGDRLLYEVPPPPSPTYPPCG